MIEPSNKSINYYDQFANQRRFEKKMANMAAHMCLVHGSFLYRLIRCCCLWSVLGGSRHENIVYVVYVFQVFQLHSLLPWSEDFPSGVYFSVFLFLISSFLVIWLAKDGNSEEQRNICWPYQLSILNNAAVQSIPVWFCNLIHVHPSVSLSPMLHVHLLSYSLCLLTCSPTVCFPPSVAGVKSSFKD